MKIGILDLRLMPGGRTLKAFADILINDIRVNDFRILQTNGRVYVKAPFTTYKNKAGEIAFRQIIHLPDEVRGRIDTMLLSEYYHRERERTDGEEQPD